MEIVEYGEVDPLEVLHLNLLCLDFSLTPELVATIRRMDPRPFPFFALYARVDGRIAGQVGVFRLPVVSTDGVEEVGGVWAVATHPACRRQGIATRLLDEAHQRMRAAGLRFSTLGTDRYRVAHGFYRKLGYEDVHASASVLLRSEELPISHDLRAERAGGESDLALADRLFERIATNRLGFARRHTPFFAFLDKRGYLKAENLWILRQGDEPVGYAAVAGSGSVATIANLLVTDSTDPEAAVAAVAAELDAPYLRLRVDQRGELFRSLSPGVRQARPSWETFMVKPLDRGLSVADFRSQHGVDTDRFLLSYLDIT